MALLPNPAGDLLKRVDRTLEAVAPVLGRVDGTLVTVDGTLTSVDELLADATAVLKDVRGVLGELADQLRIVERLPDMERRLVAISEAVGAEASPAGAS